MALFIAKAFKGKEFIYSRDTMHNVSVRSAERIRDALNEIRWQLKDEEVWHIYESDWYAQQFITKKFIVRNGALKEVRY